MTRITPEQLSVLSAMALCSILASGCKSDNDTSTASSASGGKSSAMESTGGNENVGAAAGSGGQSSAKPPLYAVATQVFTEDTETSYVVLTESLQGGELSLDDAIELGGRAILTAPPEGGALLVGSNESPLVTRYLLDADASLKLDKSVSFQGYGVAAIGEYQGQFQWASAKKAYYFDSRTAQIIVFDPEAMTTTKSLDLAALTLEDNVMTFSPAPLRVDSTLLMPVGWRGTTGTTVPSQTGLVVVDMNTDEVTTVTDARCGYARDIALGHDGYAYVATDAFASAVHRISESGGPKPCLLRFDLEAKRFDSDFYVDLTALAGGMTLGSLLATSSGKTFLRQLDESLATVTADSVPRVLASSKVWSYREVTLGDEPSLREVLTEVRSGGSMLPIILDERTFVPEFTGQAETTLREVTNGPSSAALTTTGLVFSAVQLR